MIAEGCSLSDRPTRTRALDDAFVDCTRADGEKHWIGRMATPLLGLITEPNRLLDHQSCPSRCCWLWPDLLAAEVNPLESQSGLAVRPDIARSG